MKQNNKIFVVQTFYKTLKVISFRRKEALKKIVYFIIEAFSEKQLIWKLAVNDLKAKFANSFLGTIWAFIQPLITLLVMWYVFQLGFKNPPIDNVPFIMWLSPAFLSWTFFSDSLVSTTNCLTEYSYLVKKVNFCVSKIPIVKIISSALVHCGFIVFLFFMMVCCGVKYSIYNFQILYYFICMLVLLLGMAWLLSSISPFVKDVLNIVNVLIQIGFWATPIFWNPVGMSKSVQNFLMINPMFYICQGYRDSLINGIWFWEKGIINWIFWVEALIFLIVGSYLFNKLRPQFADVL